MTSFSAPLIRGLSVVAIGTVLALSHIAFAAAAPAPSQVISGALAVTKAADVESTSSISSGQELAENCYIAEENVKSTRGKTILIQIQECD